MTKTKLNNLQIILRLQQENGAKNTKERVHSRNAAGN